MLYSEIIAVCSQIHTKHTRTITLCGQNVELVHVKLVVRILTTGLAGLYNYRKCKRLRNEPTTALNITVGVSRNVTLYCLVVRY